MRRILICVVVILSMFVTEAVATESEDTNNIQIQEVSVERIPCNPNEDTLSCAYRVMLEKKILEHPRQLIEIESGLKMPVKLYL